MKRYRVEAQAPGSTVWEPIHYTGSLPVAKRYAAMMLASPAIQAIRVMNQMLEMEVTQ